MASALLHRTRLGCVLQQPERGILPDLRCSSAGKVLGCAYAPLITVDLIIVVRDCNGVTLSIALTFYDA